MTELITAAQMRAIEAEAIAAGEVTGLELMERAGARVVEAIFEEWPELAATRHRALVLCGPGNNGGDGFVVARLLKEWGWEVTVQSHGAPAATAPDAVHNYQRWCDIGPVFPLSKSGLTQDEPPDLVVDALFGTCLSRPLAGYEEVLNALEQVADRFEMGEGRGRVVAIDLPSGLCADSGRAVMSADGYGPGVGAANLTVTFHRAKLGHYLADGPAACRAVRVADIGLKNADAGVALVGDVRGLGKHPLDHKYGHGHAVVLSGPMGRSGAARLAARAALRVGAGLVTVAAPGSAMMECATQLTAIMLKKSDGAAGLQSILADKRLNALCLGPGLGVGQGTRDLVTVALADKTRGVVLDADALTSFADNPAALFALLHPRVVLTPHMGEFVRLFPDIAQALEAPARAGPAYSKVDAVRVAAARAGCVVLLKGSDTVISDPSGWCAIHAAAYARAAPWLATAGSGDVLAGLITGLLARGSAPHVASKTAAWLHVEAARTFGPGLIAEDLPEMLPKVFRQLGL